MLEDDGDQKVNNLIKTFDLLLEEHGEKVLNGLLARYLVTGRVTRNDIQMDFGEYGIPVRAKLADKLLGEILLPWFKRVEKRRNEADYECPSCHKKFTLSRGGK